MCWVEVCNSQHKCSCQRVRFPMRVLHDSKEINKLYSKFSTGSKSQEARVQLSNRGPLKTNFLDITLIYLFDVFCRVDILNNLRNTKFKFHNLIGKL